MSLNPENKLVLAALALIVVASACTLRVVYIAADPPHGLSYSRGPYTDEGLKYYSSRNMALFGMWKPATPDAVAGPFEPSPVPTSLGAAVFKLFGSGRVQARIISLSSGVVSCLLLVLIGMRGGRPAVGLLAGAFAATNFALVSYDRLALFESPALFLCLCAAFLFLEGGRLKIFLVPLFLLLAYFTRITSLAVAAALAASLACQVWTRLAWPRSRKFTVFGAGAVALIAVVVLIAVLVPASQLAAQFEARLSAPRLAGLPPLLVAADLSARSLSDSALALWMPVTLVLALLSLANVVSRQSASLRRDDMLFLFWFLFALAMVALLDYRPTRYYVLILPAACYLAASWVIDLASTAMTLEMRRWALARWLVLRLAGAALAVAVVLRFILSVRSEFGPLLGLDASGLKRFSDFVEYHFIGGLGAAPPDAAASVLVSEMWWHVLSLAVLAAALTGLTLGLRLLVHRFMRRRLPERPRLIAAAVVASLIVLGQVSLFVSHYEPETRRYEVAAAERRILKAIGSRPDACIAGNWAPTLCMGTPYAVLPFARGNGNAWDTFKRFPVTHLLLERGAPDEEIFMRRTYPREMSRCRLLADFTIDFYTIGLFEYDLPAETVRPPWPFDERAPQ